MLVRLNSTLRGQAGIQALVVDLQAGASVRDVLVQAIRQNPVVLAVLTDDRGNVRADIVIFHNGRNIRLQEGMETTMAADGRLDLFPQTGAQRAFA